MEVKLKVGAMIYSAWVVEKVPSLCISNSPSSPFGLVFVDDKGLVMGTIDDLVGDDSFCDINEVQKVFFGEETSENDGDLDVLNEEDEWLRSMHDGVMSFPRGYSSLPTSCLVGGELSGDDNDMSQEDRRCVVSLPLADCLCLLSRDTDSGITSPLTFLGFYLQDNTPYIFLRGD